MITGIPAETLHEIKEVLKRQFDSQISRLRESQIVPEEICKSYFVSFHINIDDITKKVCEGYITRISSHHAYHDLERRVLTVISPTPWSTKETIIELQESSTEPPFGYVNLFGRMFINNWPDNRLKYLMHIIYCLADGIQTHICCSIYGGNPAAPREYNVWPVDLLNNEEKRQIGF